MAEGVHCATVNLCKYLITLKWPFEAAQSIASTEQNVSSPQYTERWFSYKYLITFK